MRFHLPKPLHGWREFAGEVGVIVLGVLIALAAQQVVESIHERHVADDTRTAIKQELQTGLASISLRRDAELCVERRLADLRQIIDQWGRTGSYHTPDWVGAPPLIGVTLARYDAASAAGRLALLPSDEQYRLGMIAEGLRKFAETQTEEATDWAKLREVQSGADALSLMDRSVVRGALQDAQLHNYYTKLMSRQQLALAARQGLKPDFTAFRQRAGLTWKKGNFRPSVCARLDTAPTIANADAVVPLPE